ncbi:MAG: hypothetical protein ACRCY8_05050 [Dermatophilaceae bacterium]
MNLSRRRAVAGVVALVVMSVPGAAWAASAGSTAELPAALRTVSSVEGDRAPSHHGRDHGPGGPRADSRGGGGHGTGQPPSEPSAVDHGSERFQPGYLGGRLVVYQPGAPVAKAPVYPLYQVRYPDGWPEWTARPLCNFCDHAQNGRDVADFHDHVLTRPDRRSNAAGAVTWHVYDVVPAYTADQDRDAELGKALAALLPVQSVAEVRRLVDRRMPDGRPLVRVVDTGIEFGGPVTSTRY